jgi:hypothetical protein
LKLCSGRIWQGDEQGQVVSTAESITNQPMPGLLSLPSDLLYEIIETVSYSNQSQLAISMISFYQCAQPERCRLRATCKVLNEHAEPIVFRRLCLYAKRRSPHTIERQILALATRSSKACEFTRELRVVAARKYPASEQSWPHFGNCDDLRVHLSTAISMLKNLTRFRLAATPYRMVKAN